MLYLVELLQERYKIARLCKRGARIASSARIHPSTIIHHPKNFSIGANSGIGNWCYLNAKKYIFIGKGVLIGPSCLIHSYNHYKYRKSPVIIKDNAWIGAHVVILPGVTIEENSIVGAGTVVTKSFPANSLITGFPGMVRKKIIEIPTLSWGESQMIDQRGI